MYDFVKLSYLKNIWGRTACKFLVINFFSIIVLVLSDLRLEFIWSGFYC